MTPAPETCWAYISTTTKGIEMNKTALEILESGLKAIGADGLSGDDCGCVIGDLVPCGSDCTECVAAKRIDARELTFYGYEANDDCDYAMIALSAVRSPTVKCDECGKDFLESDLIWTGTRHLCDDCWCPVD
jgi:hypothetical protein